MCTLSIIPKENTWILTHNRDESVKRGLASLPKIETINEQKVISPIDPLGGGTWWMAGKKGDVVFLLNGGFEKHKRSLPYRHSRGLVIPALFEYGDLSLFQANYDFEGLEPFTLAGIFTNVLFELVWTGNEIRFKKLNAEKKHIWASSTLYPAEWSDKRKEWLDRYLESENSISAESIWNFHHTSFTKEKEYDMLMERFGHLRTVAVSQVIFEKNQELKIRYEDRERQNDQKFQI